MSTVLLILQLILSVVLTVLILLQRSEGGALGIGGGGGGGLMSGRSAATNIVRMTTFVGLLFVLNCVALTIVFNRENSNRSLLEQATADAPLTGDRVPAETTIPREDGVPDPVDISPDDTEFPPEPDDE